ncbi:MAG: SDR family NAD(P)-dependent oxidoreductase [Alphaproteobacteria bacterium]|nr:SDR family NAD(P)-dependent oxidoreductase [Alphaproteobacteria bacterium]
MNDAPGRLQGRISVITGASRGLGAAIAKRFAGEGSHVVLVARTVGGLEEVDDAIRAAGGAATLVPLDLTEFDRIDEMGAALARRFGRIDVLVGNAGILGTLSPMGHIETQVWDRVIAVNLTANWRLIRSFDPLLRASDSGRAIFVTSGAAGGAHPYWGAYAVSKAALEAMVKTWAGEVTKTPVKVNLVDPGALRTSMRAEAYPGEDPETVRPAGEVTDTFVELAEAASTRHGEIVRAP